MCLKYLKCVFVNFNITFNLKNCTNKFYDEHIFIWKITVLVTQNVRNKINQILKVIKTAPHLVILPFNFCFFYFALLILSIPLVAHVPLLNRIAPSHLFVPHHTICCHHSKPKFHVFFNHHINFFQFFPSFIWVYLFPNIFMIIKVFFFKIVFLLIFGGYNIMYLDIYQSLIRTFILLSFKKSSNLVEPKQTTLIPDSRTSLVRSSFKKLAKITYNLWNQLKFI